MVTTEDYLFASEKQRRADHCGIRWSQALKYVEMWFEMRCGFCIW